MPEKESYVAFLSYDRTDYDKVREVAAALHERGVSTWDPVEEIAPGQHFGQRFTEGLSNSRACLLFLGSDELKEDQKKAISFCLNKNKPIIPVILTDDSHSLPEELVEVRKANADDIDGLIWGITDKKPGPSTTPPKRPIRFHRPFLLSLQLINVRLFKRFKCDFGKGDVPRRWTLLQGDNGMGKTTVLRAIALLTAGSDAFAELLGEPERWIRNGETACEISGTFLDPDGNRAYLRLQLKRGQTISQVFESNKELFKAIDKAIEASSAHYATFGFGVTRRLSRQEPSPGSRANSYEDERAQGVATLFSSDMILQPLQKTVIDLNYRRGTRGLEIVKGALARLFPEVTFSKIDRERSDIVFYSQNNGSLLLDQLSDGLQSMGAWWGDLLYHLTRLDPWHDQPLDIPGLLLLDEIDLHLHPNWQRGLREFLLEKLPNFQIVATSHSPFVLQSLQPGELIKLDGDVTGDYADQPIEDIAEDVMDVPVPQRSKRFRDMTEAAEQYYALLERAGQADPAELARIKEKLDELSARYNDNPAYVAFLERKRAVLGIDEAEQ